MIYDDLNAQNVDLLVRKVVPVDIGGQPIVDDEGVSVETPEYRKMMLYLDLPRALMSGTIGMQFLAMKMTPMGMPYMPREMLESSMAYKSRISKSILLEMFARTVTKLTGEVFSREVVLREDMPKSIVDWAENVDLQGNNLTQFAEEFFSNSLIEGACHLLVDYPNIQKQDIGGKPHYYDKATDTWRLLTQAEMQANGWKPNWVLVKATDLIGYRDVYDGTQWSLSQIRIRENIAVPDGKYGSKDAQRIRVIEPGRFELWEMQENEKSKQWVMIDSGETTSKKIKLYSFIPGQPLGRLTARSPLEGLAWLNLLHWQSMSDQRNILHYARLVLYFGKMLQTGDDGNVEFGPNKLIHSVDPQADLKCVEHSGRAIGAGAEDLKNLETNMAMYGLGYLMPRSGGMTATARAIDAAESDSTLKRWALSLKDVLEDALVGTAEFFGLQESEVGSIDLNTEFKDLLSGQHLTVILEGFKSGMIPRELAIEELKRRGILNEDTDIAQVNAMLEAENRMKIGQLGGLGGHMPTLGNKSGSAAVDNTAIDSGRSSMGVNPPTNPMI